MGIDIHKGYLLPDGILQSVPGSAALLAIVNGDDQCAAVNHILIAADHAQAGIVALHHCLTAARRQQTPPPGLVLFAPAAGLAGVGDSRFQLYVRVLLLQSQYRFRKIEVAAPGHAADEIPHSAFVGGVHCSVQLSFQGRAAGVPLASAPGQTLRPVASKAAGALSFVHQHHAPLFHVVLWYYRTNFLICKGDVCPFEPNVLHNDVFIHSTSS